MKNVSTTQKTGFCAPQNAKVIKITELTHNTRLLELQFTDSIYNERFEYSTGQFILLNIFGIGEVPLGITSSPTKKGSFQIAVRKVGNVTKVIHTLVEGAIVGVKGPFGRGFPVEENKQKDLLFVAGGIGYFPIRSAFRYAVANRKNYRNVTFLYGDRCPDDVLFQEENDEYKENKDINFLQTVDRDDDRCWDGNVGVVTTLFPGIKDDIDPENTVVFVCGPPIMYKFVIIELVKLGIKSKNIFLSLERKMKCGIGKCCHCGIGDKFVCLDGPVFSLNEIRGLMEAL